VGEAGASVIYLESLVDRVVVVIGGSSGIGEATAAAAASLGARVIVSSRDADRVARVVERIGDRAHGFPADIGSERSVDALFEHIGLADHVVVTAGDALEGSVKLVDLGAARRFAEARFWGLIYVARAATFRDGGSLTVVSGTAHWRPRAGVGLAMAMAGAVDALVRALAVELAPIRVNAVAPGTVRTPRTARTHGGPDGAEKYVASRAAILPAGRVGDPTDIAQAILAVATNPYITGAVLNIDGGGLLV
jgi:NAD(P)-dependent dehydrogenase (short-subunit alcohol dehydrogenase family)